jgi:hypothetical protein
MIPIEANPLLLYRKAGKRPSEGRKTDGERREGLADCSGGTNPGERGQYWPR